MELLQFDPGTFCTGKGESALPLSSGLHLKASAPFLQAQGLCTRETHLISDGSRRPGSALVGKVTLEMGDVMAQLADALLSSLQIVLCM